jgi:hypothetical protein
MPIPQNMNIKIQGNMSIHWTSALVYTVSTGMKSMFKGVDSETLFGIFSLLPCVAVTFPATTTAGTSVPLLRICLFVIVY